MRNNRARKQSESRAQTPVLIYLDARFSKHSLVRTIEPLYLGEAAAYRLIFSAEMLPDVERCFDGLIEKYGYRSDVDFEYAIKEGKANVRGQ